MKKMNNKGIAHLGVIIGIVAVAAIIIIGVIVYNANNNDSASQLDDSSIRLSEKDPLNTEGLKSIDEITALAGDLSSSEIIGIELKVEDGQTVYAVFFSDGSSVYLNAQTGVEVEIDSEGSKTGTALPIGDLKLSIVKAIALAKEQHSGEVVEVELELDDGILKYEVKFKDETKVKLNAQTGAVIKIESKDGDVEMMKGDDDFDDDGIDNDQDEDDDNDGIEDDEDEDDDGDEIDDEDDEDDDNDGIEDDEDEEQDEEESQS